MARLRNANRDADGALVAVAPPVPRITHPPRLLRSQVKQHVVLRVPPPLKEIRIPLQGLEGQAQIQEDVPASKLLQAI